ncbi:hypothetical protein [Micrococcus sp.]|uniref:hypothetical protein n=1 Tax=Micrococcus sp. TaxID=1271 RepID=UPI002A91DC0C|nr:hypothetical protein [Micrococcus sp.]MDY6055476.1 hypothetical protein [Micrococcus sp.]
MIRSLLLLGTGAAAGWLAHRATEAGRRADDQGAARRVREALDPTHLGRSAGQAVGDAAAEVVAEGARAFTQRLRADAPPWVGRLLEPGADIIPGEATDGPAGPTHPTTTRKDPTA